MFLVLQMNLWVNNINLLNPDQKINNTPINAPNGFDGLQ